MAFLLQKRAYRESSAGKRPCTSFAFKCASRLASSLCYSLSQRSPSLFGVAKAPAPREGTMSLPAGGQGKSDLLSATISSTSSVGSSNSPTSTWTGLAPTGSCKRGQCFCWGCTKSSAPVPGGQSSPPIAPAPLCFGDALPRVVGAARDG